VAKYSVGVAGNPNCGKTTLFNALTGSRHTVGNWPGVTVERKVGEYSFDGDRIEVVDLPGIYSLSARSIDERVARDYVLSGEPRLVINIVDGTNLERNLYLTLQLIEMRAPLVVALNMMDVVRADRTEIDVEQLAAQLGCPVVPIVARTGQGVDELQRVVGAAVREPAPSPARVKYPTEVEDAISRLADALAENAEVRAADARWSAIKLLEDDPAAQGEAVARNAAGDSVSEVLTQAKRRIEARLGDESDIVIADGRFGFINSITRRVVSRSGQARRSMTDAIDKVVLNRALSIPVFIVMMYLTFTLTISFGGCFIDFADRLFGAVFVEGLGRLLVSVGSPGWLVVFLADGLGGGIQLIATLIPPIGLMFVCLAVLEDSGYMARAAFVMDRLMRFIGLPGKAFVPMLIGIGCNVPAIMATRTLERQRDRLLTIAINPFMSCAARLPIYALFGVAFFPQTRGLLVFSLYVVGILLAIVTGLILKSTILRAEVPTFVMELPPYHAPTVNGVAVHAWYRLKGFVLRAGKVILAVFVMMSFLSSVGTDGTFGHENQANSVLAAVGRAIVPIFEPMGVERENWPAAVGLFSGLFAKEAVVGTLNSLYVQESAGPARGRTPEEERFDLWDEVKGAAATIPVNFRDTFGGGPIGRLFDPLGIRAGTEEEPDVSTGAYTAIKKRFGSRRRAYAYLLFVLIYAPCVAAMAAIYRETNLRWTVFVAGYLTVLAWMVSVAFYQIATIGQHAASSVAWLAGLAAVFTGYIVLMRRIGARTARRRP